MNPHERIAFLEAELARVKRERAAWIVAWYEAQGREAPASVREEAEEK